MGSPSAKPTLILENITLKGIEDNHSALITVKGGTLILRNGGKISGNSSKFEGGGVYVYNGSFEMHGGIISGNKASDGGGVYIRYGYGNFTKKSQNDFGTSGIIYGSHEKGNDPEGKPLKNTAAGASAAVHDLSTHTLNQTVKENKNISEKGYMPLTKEEYYNSFTADKEILKAALDRAWQTRNFEIDKFWIRTAFFGGFISIIFGAYINILTKNTSESPSVYPLINLDVYLILLGIIFSFAWLFAIRGSQKWQENWEAHIEMLENKITGPLYKTIYCDSKPFYSVTKINIFLSKVIIVVWIFMLFLILTKKFLGTTIDGYILVIGAIL